MAEQNRRGRFTVRLLDRNRRAIVDAVLEALLLVGRWHIIGHAMVMNIVQYAARERQVPDCNGRTVVIG